MLGLAEQVGGDVRRVRGLVGEDQDLGGPGLGVDADLALEQPLRGDRPDRARPGHEVDPRAGADAVGEHRDGLGAADGVHLLDAEQRARGQDRRVRQAGVFLLRRGRQRDRAHAGDLRGDDVHQHAGDQRSDAAGHVEADPVHRHLAVGDPGTGSELGGGVLLQLGRAGGPQPADRLLQPGPDVRVQVRQGVAQRLRRHPDVGLGDAVVLLGQLQDRLEPAGADRLADRVHRRDRRLDVEVGARHHVPVVLGTLPAQVDPAHHADDSTNRRPSSPVPDEGWTALRTAAGSRSRGRPTTGSPAGR